MNKITCALKNKIDSPKGTGSFTLTPDEKGVYVACKNGSVNQLDLSSERVSPVFKHDNLEYGGTRIIKLSSNGKWFIIAFKRTILIMCVGNSSENRLINKDNTVVEHVCISDCGSICAFVTFKPEVGSWAIYVNTKKGYEWTSTLLIISDEVINSIVIDKAGTRILASLGDSGTIMTFSAKDDWKRTENISPYGELMVLKETGTLLTNTVKPASLITWSGADFSVRDCIITMTDGYHVKSIATSRDAKTIMVASDECIEVYRPMCQTLQLKEEECEGSLIKAELSMDGSKIVTLRSDGYIRIYSIADQDTHESSDTESRKRVLEAAANLLTELAKSMGTKKQKWGE